MPEMIPAFLAPHQFLVKPAEEVCGAAPALFLERAGADPSMLVVV